RLSSDSLRLGPDIASPARRKAAPRPEADPLTLFAGFVQRFLIPVSFSCPASLMDFEYSFVPWIFSMTARALISWTRLRSTAVDIAVDWPNLESTVYMLMKPSLRTCSCTRWFGPDSNCGGRIRDALRTAGVSYFVAAIAAAR